MRTFGTLVRRELGTYLYSWTGYLIIFMVLLICGVFMAFMLEQLKSTSRPLTEDFTPMFWTVLLPVAPLLTMRLFAMERATGTFENLMTAPVSDAEVVWAKFSAAYLFYLLLWIPLAVGVMVLRRHLTHPEVLENGLIVSTYVGMALIGAVYIALGTFASAVSRTQINAAMIAFSMGFFLFMAGLLSVYQPFEPVWVKQLLSHIGIVSHLQDFTRGIFDTRYVILDVTLTALFLYGALKVVESRRWR